MTALRVAKPLVHLIDPSRYAIQPERLAEKSRERAR